MTDDTNRTVGLTPQVAIKVRMLQESGADFEVRSLLDLPVVGENGEEDTLFKRREDCTAEEIQTWVERELRRASDIEDDVAAVVACTGGLPDPDEEGAETR